MLEEPGNGLLLKFHSRTLWEESKAPAKLLARSYRGRAVEGV